MPWVCSLSSLPSSSTSILKEFTTKCLINRSKSKARARSMRTAPGEVTLYGRHETQAQTTKPNSNSNSNLLEAGGWSRRTCHKTNNELLHQMIYECEYSIFNIQWVTCVALGACPKITVQSTRKTKKKPKAALCNQIRRQKVEYEGGGGGAGAAGARGGGGGEPKGIEGKPTMNIHLP